MVVGFARLWNQVYPQTCPGTVASVGLAIRAGDRFSQIAILGLGRYRP